MKKLIKGFANVDAALGVGITALSISLGNFILNLYRTVRGKKKKKKETQEQARGMKKTKSINSVQFQEQEEIEEARPLSRPPSLKSILSTNSHYCAMPPADGTDTSSSDEDGARIILQCELSNLKRRIQKLEREHTNK